MDRRTITTLARAMGGRVIYSGNDHINYEFRTEEKTLAFRSQIPFASQWGCVFTPGWDAQLVVYLDRLRDY